MREKGFSPDMAFFSGGHRAQCWHQCVLGWGLAIVRRTRVHTDTHTACIDGSSSSPHGICHCHCASYNISEGQAVTDTCAHLTHIGPGTMEGGSSKSKNTLRVRIPQCSIFLLFTPSYMLLAPTCFPVVNHHLANPHQHIVPSCH